MAKEKGVFLFFFHFFYSARTSGGGSEEKIKIRLVCGFIDGMQLQREQREKKERAGKVGVSCQRQAVYRGFLAPEVLLFYFLEGRTRLTK